MGEMLIVPETDVESQWISGFGENSSCFVKCGVSASDVIGLLIRQPSKIQDKVESANSGEAPTDNNKMVEIAALLNDGVCYGGGHHKQWHLERIAEVLGVELEEHDPGIAP